MSNFGTTTRVVSSDDNNDDNTHNHQNEGRQTEESTIRGRGIYALVSSMKGLQNQLNQINSTVCSLEEIINGLTDYNLETSIPVVCHVGDDDDDDDDEEEEPEVINSWEDQENPGGRQNDLNAFRGIERSLQKLHDNLALFSQRSGICAWHEGYTIQTKCTDGGATLHPVPFAAFGMTGIRQLLTQISRQITELHVLVCEEMVPNIYTPPTEPVGGPPPSPPSEDDDGGGSNQEEENFEETLDRIEQKLDELLEIHKVDVSGNYQRRCISGEEEKAPEISWGGNSNALLSLSNQMNALYQFMKNETCQIMEGTIYQYPIEFSYPSEQEDENESTQGGS